MLIGLMFIAVAQQSAAPISEPVPRMTALRGEAWEHNQDVSILSVSSVHSTTLPFDWVSAGFRDSAPGGTVTVDPETGARTYWSEARQREDVLAMDQAEANAAIAALGGSAPATTTVALPADSTLVVAWDVTSGQVQVQMGRDFKTPRFIRGQSATSPYCYRTSETPLRKLEVDAGGAVVVTQLREDGEPPKEMTLWTERAGGKIGEGQRVSPGQVEIGFDAEANSGAGATTATFSHGMQEGAFELVTARSADGLTYFFWYREAPQPQ